MKRIMPIVCLSIMSSFASASPAMESLKSFLSGTNPIDRKSPDASSIKNINGVDIGFGGSPTEQIIVETRNNIELFFTATDDLSGLDLSQKLGIKLIANSGNEYGLSASLIEVGADVYKWSVKLNENQPSGEYGIAFNHFGSISDNAGNGLFGQGSYTPLTIKNSSGVEDTTPPKIISAKFENDDVVEAGQSKKIIFLIKDDASGVDTGRIYCTQLIHEQNIKRFRNCAKLVSLGNDEYSYDIKVKHNVVEGSYIIYDGYLGFADKLGNYADIPHKLSIGVANTFSTIDSTPPKIANVSIADNCKLVRGETAEIVFQIADDISGFDNNVSNSVRWYLNPQRKESFSIDLRNYNKTMKKVSEGVYSLTFPINKYAELGEYTLSTSSDFALCDKAENCVTEQKHISFKFSVSDQSTCTPGVEVNDDIEAKHSFTSSDSEHSNVLRQ